MGWNVPVSNWETACDGAYESAFCIPCYAGYLQLSGKAKNSINIKGCLAREIVDFLASFQFQNRKNYIDFTVSNTNCRDQGLTSGFNLGVFGTNITSPPSPAKSTQSLYLIPSRMTVFCNCIFIERVPQDCKCQLILRSYSNGYQMIFGLALETVLDYSQ